MTTTPFPSKIILFCLYDEMVGRLV